MRVWIALFAATLFGCVVGPHAVQVPVLCRSGPDCELRWGRAQEWLVTTSGLHLRTATSTLLVTENNPVKFSPSIQIIRTPQGDGSERILMSANCDDPLIGCLDPPTDKLQAGFLQAVTRPAGQ